MPDALTDHDRLTGARRAVSPFRAAATARTVAIRFTRTVACTAAIMLIGCSGGDDAPEPPAPLAETAHTIAPTEAQARGLAGVVGRTGIAGYRIMRDLADFEAAQRVAELLFPRLFGAEVSEDGGVVEVDCRRNPLRLAPLGLCYGELRFETNRRHRDGPILTGTLFSVDFDNFNIVSGNLQRLRVSGGLRIDYLTSYTDNPRSGTVRYTSRGLSTNRDGTVFDARSSALTASHGSGQTILESDSRRYLDIDAASTSDGVGLVRSGRIRTNFEAGYVDIDYSNWSVVDGIVQVGSTAAVTGAGNSLASVAVLASNAQTVTLAVSITRDGVPLTFTVEVPASALNGD